VEYDAVMSNGLVDLQAHSSPPICLPAPPDITLPEGERVAVEVRIPLDPEVGQGVVTCLRCDGTVDVMYTDDHSVEDHIIRDYITVVGGGALPPAPAPPPSYTPPIIPPFCISLPPYTPPGSIIVAVSPEGCLMNVVVPPYMGNVAQLLVYPPTEFTEMRADGYLGCPADELPPPSYDSLYIMPFDSLPPYAAIASNPQETRYASNGPQIAMIER
jgi:hypothetical protein